jgi:hypothetical protein
MFIIKQRHAATVLSCYVFCVASLAVAALNKTEISGRQLLSIRELPLVALGLWPVTLVATVVVLAISGYVKENRIRRAALKAVGRIITSEIDRSGHGSSWLKLTLDVERVGLPPYRTQARANLPVHEISRARPGNCVTVLVDPRDHKSVLVDFGEQGGKIETHFEI